MTPDQAPNPTHAQALSEAQSVCTTQPTSAPKELPTEGSTQALRRATAAGVKRPAKAFVHRILVRKAGATKFTTVSVAPQDFDRLLRFSYGDKLRVHAALREAALYVSGGQSTAGSAAGEFPAIAGVTRKRQDFSERVRARAFKALRGAYRPELAPKALTADEQLARENNQAWDSQSTNTGQGE